MCWCMRNVNVVMGLKYDCVHNGCCKVVISIALNCFIVENIQSFAFFWFIIHGLHTMKLTHSFHLCHRFCYGYVISLSWIDVICWSIFFSASEVTLKGVGIIERYLMMTSWNGNMKWKRYWPFVRGIHRSSVHSPHKGQWRGALMFSLIYTWINGWVNNDEAGDLRRHRAHYGVTVM